MKHSFILRLRKENPMNKMLPVLLILLVLSLGVYFSGCTHNQKTVDTFNEEFAKDHGKITVEEHLQLKLAIEGYLLESVPNKESLKIFGWKSLQTLGPEWDKIKERDKDAIICRYHYKDGDIIMVKEGLFWLENNVVRKLDLITIRLHMKGKDGYKKTTDKFQEGI